LGERVIEVAGLSKQYPGGRRGVDLIRMLVRGQPPREAVCGALQDVNLTLDRGESLAVVGRNGSGKTTLLRVLAGALAPSTGCVEVRGRVASLIDLGAGIDPEFSGAENALMLGTLAGTPRRRMAESMDSVRSFSGLGDAFEEKVRTYSSGMSLRLAFAAAVHCEPDLLLIDEVLAVGDAFFQQRCLRRIRALQAAGCATVLVTHDPSAATSFCDRAIWLEAGRIASAGDSARVMREYLGTQYSDAADLFASPEDDAPLREPEMKDEVKHVEGLPNIDHRYGDGRAEIIGMVVLDQHEEPVACPRPGQRLRVTITADCREDMEAPIVGFSLRDRLGEIVAATNTSQEMRALARLEAGDRISVEFELRWPRFTSGMFSFSPAIANGSLTSHAMSDWVDNVIVLESENPDAPYGRLQLEVLGIRCGVAAGRDS